MRSALLLALAAVAGAGCSGSHTANDAGSSSGSHLPGTVVAGVRFVAAPAGLVTRCRRTAATVRYPVPCPTRIPAELGAWPQGQSVIGPASAAAERAIVHQPGCPLCARARGWTFGSSAPPHLVISAAPRPIGNLHHAVDGSGFDPRSFVGRHGCFPRHGVCHPLLVPLGTVHAHGWRVHLVEVTPWDESAFTRHLVMVWTVAGHTYAVGFHEERGRAAARRWDMELMRGLRLVG